MSENKLRKRKAPEWFGEAGILSEEEENSFERNIADNSLDDENYIPETPKKVIATVKRVKRGSQNIVKDKAISFQNINFDAEFSRIDMERKNTEVNDTDSANVLTDQRKNVKDNYTLENLFDIMQKQLEQTTALNKKVDEMFIRMSLVESKLIRGNVKENRDLDLDETKQLRMFLKSNGLPLQNIEDLNRFEQNLKDQNFFEESVSVCLSIGSGTE